MDTNVVIQRGTTHDLLSGLRNISFNESIDISIVLGIASIYVKKHYIIFSSSLSSLKNGFRIHHISLSKLVFLPKPVIAHQTLTSQLRKGSLQTAHGFS